MALDPSIILSGKGVNIMSPAEAAQSAMTLRQFANAARDESENEAVRQAYKNNIQMSPDGTPTLNQKGMLSDLAKVSPEKALQYQGTLQKNQLDKMTQQMDLAHKLAWSMNDQNSYTYARQKAIELGLPNADKFPEQYDPQFVKNIQMRTLAAKDQLDQQNKMLDQQNKDRDFGLRERELGAKIGSGEYLPLDKKKSVEGLASKNANKISIKNQIDAVMTSWDDLSDDQKVSAGRQLLKTLNSTEGADAIGAEEAKRLGAKLEFAMGNFTNSNPTQFGRDLKGFKEQAQHVSKAIGQSVQSNQDIIDQQFGRRSSVAKTPKDFDSMSDEQLAAEYAKLQGSKHANKR